MRNLNPEIPMEGVTAQGIPYKAFPDRKSYDTSVRASFVYFLRRALGLKTDLDE